MDNTAPYVIYAFLQPKKQGPWMAPTTQAEATIAAEANVFLSARAGKIAKIFFDNRNKNKQAQSWSGLQAAFQYAQQNRCHILVTELKNLTNIDSFATQISTFLQTTAHSAFKPEILCIDQPFVHRENFLAIIEHTQKRKRMHGELIKAGLSRSSAKSGNPRAKDIINKVNRPKIENAILFALILHPIVHEYKKRGYSQRKMVEMLNTEGFFAPEGGKWVLSQLQKVLDRVRWNEAALTLANHLNTHTSPSALAERFNAENCPHPQNSLWKESDIALLQQRMVQIQQIAKINDCLVALLPVLQQYGDLPSDANVLNHALQQNGLALSELIAHESTPMTALA